MRGRTLGGVVAAALATLVLVTSADARTTIRPRSGLDDFFFHGHHGTTPFDPADTLGIEVWNCASGVMPTLVTISDPIVVCLDGADATPPLANLIYSVELPGGSCVDHGRSCFYRNPRANDRTGGIRYFRTLYTRSHGNRIWLESFGDLSAATQANMIMIVTINGRPRAVLGDTFRPLLSGGWYSDL